MCNEGHNNLIISCFMEVICRIPAPHTTPHHNHFTAHYPRPPGWAGARSELLDFMVQGKINRCRHTDHPAGCHSIRTNHCPPPPPPSPIFLQAGCPSCRPTNNVKALKARIPALHNIIYLRPQVLHKPQSVLTAIFIRRVLQALLL